MRRRQMTARLGRGLRPGGRPFAGRSFDGRPLDGREPVRCPLPLPRWPTSGRPVAARAPAGGRGSVSARLRAGRARSAVRPVVPRVVPTAGPYDGSARAGRTHAGQVGFRPSGPVTGTLLVWERS
jgi:hypothetical protein